MDLSSLQRTLLNRAQGFGRATAAFGRSRWGRRGLWLLAGLALVWLLAWWGVPPLLKQQLERQGSAALGRRLSVGAVDFKPWTLELSLHDLALARAEGADGDGDADGDGPQLQIKRIYIDGALQSLWRWLPVVDALEIDAPQLRLTHLGEGRHDAQDILERLGAGADPQAQPVRFALHNLVVRGGSLDLFDHAQARRHQLRGLELGLPFLSNLDTQRDVSVQPRLAFTLDGSPFELAASATPFADQRHAEARIQLKGLDLAPYLGYLPRGPLQVQGATLDADLRLVLGPPVLAPAAANPATSNPAAAGLASLQLSGSVQLAKLQAVDASGQPLLAFATLTLGLSDVRPLERVLHLSNLELNAPQLHVRRNAKGQFQVLTPVAPASNAIKKIAKSAGAVSDRGLKSLKTKEAEPVWDIALDRLAVQAGTLTWRDASTTPAAALVLSEVALQADALTWPLSPALSWRGSASLQGPGPAPAQGRLRFSGSGTPQAGRLALALEALPLALGGAYLAPWLVPQLSGQLSAQLGLGWRGSEVALQLRQLTLDQPALTQDAQTLASAKQLRLEDLQLDWAKRRLQLGRLALSAPQLSLARDPAGQWMFAHWLRTPATVAPPGALATPATAATAATAWTFNIQAAELDAGRLAYRDASTLQPVAFDLSELKLALSDFAPLATAATATATAPPPSPLTLSGRIRAGRTEAGQFSYRGRVGLAPLAAEGQLHASRLPVHALEPYFTDMLNLDVRRADASYQGHVLYRSTAAGTALQLKGDALLEDVRVNSVLALPPVPAALAPSPPSPPGTQGEGDSSSGRSGARGPALLNWKALNLRGLEFALAPGQASRMALAETTLRDFFARVTVFEDGRINVQDWLKTPAAPLDGAVRSAPPSTPPSAPIIHFGPVTLLNGRVAFSDRFIRPNYSANLSALTGRLGAFSSVAPQATPQMAELELRGLVEGTASLEVLGQLNPLATPLALDLRAKVRDLELAPLSPYAVKYAGHGIERGKLNVDVAYRVQANGELSARNKITLHQLVFGDPVAGAPASLPVRLAAALLADSKGVIDIELPIQGSVNDPQFSVAPVVFKALGQLLLKAVTSPFSLLGKAFGDSATSALSQVPFAPGSAELSEGARSGLDQVAQMLNSRSALKVTVVGSASLEAEREALKQQRLERLLRAEKRRSTSAGGNAEPDRTSSTSTNSISEAEYPALLAALYQRSDMVKPRNLLGLASAIPAAQMQALLLANTTLPDDAAQTLAAQRASVVRDYLLAQKLPPERLFLGAAKVLESEAQWTPSAHLNLSTQ